MDDSHILIARIRNYGQLCCLYYYQGNFYHPIFMERKIELRVRRLIKMFYKNHKKLVDKDRQHSDYKTKLQLAIEQGL